MHSPRTRATDMLRHRHLPHICCTVIRALITVHRPTTFETDTPTAAVRLGMSETDDHHKLYVEYFEDARAYTSLLTG